ncbi:replication initiator protein, partial [Nocardia cyriacigeorgica]|nr:replication initiator protein [Nocardia cyriacigeorgica]
RTAEHYDRLHAELQHTPCSPRCGVWLRYGIVPKGATAKTQPGKCKGKAHRRDTLGLPGRRVLVSRRWSNKTLPDHKQDRADFVRQTLAAVGI